MLGERLKKLRKERGLTQRELGKGILSISYISQIENHNKPIPEYLITELAKRLDVTRDQLLGAEDRKRKENVNQRISEALTALYYLRLSDAKNLIETIRNDAKEIIDNEEIGIEIAILEIMYALQLENFEEAEKKINQLKNYPVHKYPVLLYRFLRVMGVWKYRKGLYVESLEYYRQAYLMKKEKHKMSMDTAYLVYNLALSYLQLNHYQRTFYYAQLAHSCFTELGNWYGLCESLVLLGILHYYQNYHDQALEFYTKALSLAKEFSEKHLQSKILHNIGLVYEKLGGSEKAHLFWNEALRLKQKVKNYNSIAVTLYSITESFYENQEYGSFILHMDKLQEVLERCDDPHVTGKSLKLLGSYYRDIGNLDLFKSYYMKAIEKFKHGNMFFEVAELSYEVANEFKDNTLFRQAAEYYHLHHSRLKSI